MEAICMSRLSNHIYAAHIQVIYVLNERFYDEVSRLLLYFSVDGMDSSSFAIASTKAVIDWFHEVVRSSCVAWIFVVYLLTP